MNLFAGILPSIMQGQLKTLSRSHTFKFAHDVSIGLRSGEYV